MNHPQNGYTLLDSGNFQKLEQVGPWRLVRPSAQAVWQPSLPEAEWRRIDASYQRFSGGDGKWTIQNRNLPATWNIQPTPGLPTTFVIRLTDFGHLGIFPEQDSNWSKLADLVRQSPAKADFSVLNLFAYTGGSTLATAAAGAKVVHVDASKTSVAWARENAAASGLQDLPIRWIIEDVQKFVAREVRRGSTYQGIILDPPSFGRGTNNEVWNIEEHLVPMLGELRKLLAPNWAFVLLSAHSPGYTPLSLRNLLQSMLQGTSLDGVQWTPEEMVVTTKGQGWVLPSGASCLMTRKDSSTR
jgi:23S rRNA (cytosine1962-C5)-methyltransferase